MINPEKSVYGCKIQTKIMKQNKTNNNKKRFQLNAFARLNNNKKNNKEKIPIY